MRRLLTGPGAALGRSLVALAADVRDYTIGLVATAWRAWRRFFFTPADPTPLGLIRIAVGLLLVWDFLDLGADLRGNLGSDGWASPSALRDFWAEWAGPSAWSLWLAVPDRLLPAAWGAGLLVLLLFTIGLGSRVTAVLAWLVAASTVRRAPVLFFGFDQVVLTWTMYLAATGSSGQALSADRLVAGRRAPSPAPGAGPVPTVSANLGLRLIQLHLCLIYAAAGLAKLQGPAWWNGRAVLMILILPEYTARDLTWLAAYPMFLNLLTHATVALEILYPALVWVRPLRPLMLAAMIGLHLGIELTLGLTEFSLAMISGNLAFISGSGLRRCFRGAGPPKA